MALSNHVKDLILGLMGGEPEWQKEMVDGIEGGQNAIQNPLTGNLNLNNFKAINSAPPTGPQDLATKLYVDNTIGGSGLNQLTGDVTAGPGTGSQAATVVSVGGSSASNVNTATTAANAATSANTPSTIVKRDGSGNFAAGTITANLTGNASTATSATTAGSFTGSLSGDVTGTQSATVVSSVGGSSASSVNTATLAANAATSANVINTIVKRDGSGNFSAGTITASLSGNASTATTATSATTAASFTGSLSGDVTGTQSATVVSLVGGSTASSVNSATILANAATDLSTVSTLVKRDASGGTHLKRLMLDGSTSGSVSIIASATTISHTLTMPSSQGSVSTVLTNDGSGNLSWSTSGGSGANTTLSNLTNPTAINQDLHFDTGSAATLNTKDVGSGATKDLTIATGNTGSGGSSGSLSITSGTSGGSSGNTSVATAASGGTGTSGSIGVNTGNAGNTNGATGGVDISSGNSSGGITGTVTLRSGTTSGTRGKIQLKNGTEGTSGYVWTSTDTLGSGSWMPASGGGISALTGDVTASGTGSVVATVAFVGGSSASLINSAELAANAATNLSTASTIMKRDSSSRVHVKGLQIDGTTSGSISMITPATVTSYDMKFPGAQGSASQSLINDGAGNLYWGTVSGGGGGGGNFDQTLSSGQTINSSTSYTRLTGSGSTTFAQNTSGVFDDSNGIAAGSSDRMGQQFTATSSGNMTTFTIYLKTDGSSGGTLTAYLYNNVGGNGTSGTLIATSSTVNASTLTTSYAPITFTFPPTALTSGNVYFGMVGFSAMTGSPGRNGFDTSNPYSGGDSYYQNSANIGKDSTFSVSGPGSGVTTSATTAVTAGTTIGQLLTVENFSGGTNIVIKNAATTKLPNGVDYTLTPSSIMSLIWNGTNWVTTSSSGN